MLEPRAWHGVDNDPELAAIRQKMMAQIEAHPTEVTDESLVEFVRANKLAVVDVWAAWCGPCRIIGPIVDELAREMAGEVAFGKLDADANPAVMQAFGIQGIPTLLVFKEGRLVDRLVGAMPKPMLAGAIRRHT